MRTEPLLKVLFASCTEEVFPHAVSAACLIDPELQFEVVSQTEPLQGRWIRYRPYRSFADNLRDCHAGLRGKRVDTAVIVMHSRTPYWKLRLIALSMRPRRIVALNENLEPRELRFGALAMIARHIFWSAEEWFTRLLRDHSPIARLLQGVRHPVAQVQFLRAGMAGALLSLSKTERQSAGEPSPISISNRPAGVSVVIPSRDGRDKLARMLPLVLRELGSGEVIVIDNGSVDASAEFLQREFPSVLVVEREAPLGFPAAINIGVQRARFSHVCLLNNDMAVAPRFFEHLLETFEQVPGLFSANPQVFLPPGVARQETGKAVISRHPSPFEFPIRCDLPLSGEDLTYVLYGSSGCSVFDADRLLSLGGVDETYQPAYVEDLDLGVRAWQRGWPTVLAANAHVVHEHRATMSRLYSAEQLEYMVVNHWMMFLSRTIRHRGIFGHYWRHAIRQLFHSALAENEHALRILGAAGIAGKWRPCRDPTVMPDAEFFALCDGSVCVFPGKHRRSALPVVVLASCSLPSSGSDSRRYDFMDAAAVKWKQVLVSFVERSAPVAPELLEICAEVVTVRHNELDSPSFRAALRQTVRKWHPSVVRLEPALFAHFAEEYRHVRTVLQTDEISPQ
jgi:GT2 family glycosyltransferase